jgi:hypothetical protein
VIEHERPLILEKGHDGLVGGNYEGKSTAHNILRVELWWPTLHRDAKEYYQTCDVCQNFKNPSRRDEMPLNPQIALHVFDKWAI